jgi:hypothetical protein
MAATTSALSIPFFIRLRLLDLSGEHSEKLLEAISLPCLEEWTMYMGYSGNIAAAMLSLLKRSDCRLKVLNLDELHPPSEDLDALLESVPSLERIRLSSMFYSGGDIVLDILSRIFCSVSGSSDISGETPTSECFLPHLQFIECRSDKLITPFSWDSIPELYRRDHQRSLTLKAFATHADIPDKTALQLLQFAEAGADFQIVDLSAGGDFLQNFRKRRCTPEDV